MKKYEGKTINLKRLLMLGELNIRDIAAQNESLTADDYLAKVEIFIENSTELRNVLLSISELSENAKALKDLEARLGVIERSVNIAEDTKRVNDLLNIQKLLTELGSTKMNFDIDCICTAIKKGELPLAEKLASEAVVKFSNLCVKIKNTFLVNRNLPNQSVERPDNSACELVLLSEALEYLDHEEANRKLRILAVDDVTVVLNSISSILNPYYEVFAIKNSTQVEKFLSHTTPELFLLDIEMHGMNGFDLIPIIRQFETHKDTPIIFLTGNATFNNLKEAIALGACDFISKPVNADILLDKISRNIKRKKAY